MPSTQTLVLSAALIAGGTIIAMLVIKGRQDSTITAASILDPKTERDVQDATSWRFQEYQADPQVVTGLMRHPTSKLETQDEKAPQDYIGMHLMGKAFALKPGQRLYWTSELLRWVREQ